MKPSFVLMRSFAVLVCATLAAEGAHHRRLGKDRVCGCDCCETAGRTNSEMIDGGTALKCVAKVEGASDACPSTCDASGSQVMTNLITSTAQTMQFCFLECKPYDVVIGTACVTLSNDEIARARTADGSGEDIHALPVVQEVPTKPPEPAEPLPIPEDRAEKMIIPSATVPNKVEEVLEAANEARTAGVDGQADIDSFTKEAGDHADKVEARAAKAQKLISDFDPQAAVAAAGASASSAPAPAAASPSFLQAAQEIADASVGSRS